MNKVRLAFGVLAGVAIGAAIGTLYAPAKGSALRKKIAQKSDDYVGELETKYNDLMDRITNKFWSAKQNVARITENGKHKVEEGLSKAEEAVAVAKQKI
ncbi:MAG: YtxH domain-containing protein [Saprospiraceae bacterium]|nr:YtxH domain-containing protein [Saprospiraceae bacterium]